MDFELSPEMHELRQNVRRLAQTKIKPRAREIDSTGEYPEDIFEELRKADLLGLCIPEEYGGSGAGIMGLTIAIEEVTKYSNVIGLMLLLTRLPTGPIMIAGNEEQKQGYLPGIADGSKRAAFCLSEPGAGSDVAGMRSNATPDPDECRPTGLSSSPRLVIRPFANAPTSMDSSWRPTHRGSRARESTRKWGSRASTPPKSSLRT
jgi:alkylation response protein AidB-like acyl-CoA dehydrogenase